MTTKVTFTDQARPDQTKPMSHMQPGEICQVVGGHHDQQIVMRTLSTIQFEIMILSYFSPDSCWSINKPDMTVRPYYGQVILQRTEP